MSEHPLLEALKLLYSAHEKLVNIPDGLNAQILVLKAMDEVNSLIVKSVSPKVAQKK